MEKNIIEINHVDMRFNLEEEKTDTIKEYFVKLLKGKLRFSEFYAVKDVSFTVQSIIDSIAPAILPTGLTLLCMNILKKGKVAPAVLIIILVIASIILHCFGIL